MVFRCRQNNVSQFDKTVKIESNEVDLWLNFDGIQIINLTCLTPAWHFSISPCFLQPIRSTFSHFQHRKPFGGRGLWPFSRTSSGPEKSANDAAQHNTIINKTIWCSITPLIECKIWKLLNKEYITRWWQFYSYICPELRNVVRFGPLPVDKAHFPSKLGKIAKKTPTEVNLTLSPTVSFKTKSSFRSEIVHRIKRLLFEAKTFLSQLSYPVLNLCLNFRARSFIDNIITMILYHSSRFCSYKLYSPSDFIMICQTTHLRKQAFIIWWLSLQIVLIYNFSTNMPIHTVCVDELKTRKRMESELSRKTMISRRLQIATWLRKYRDTRENYCRILPTWLGKENDHYVGRKNSSHFLTYILMKSRK